MSSTSTMASGSISTLGIAFPSYLVTPKELHEALQKNPSSEFSLPRVVPLSAGSFLPNDGRKGIDVFRERRIPDASFFDLDNVTDKSSTIPHMLPTAAHFASTMSALGIRKEDTVVVYDTFELGITSAPRAAWTLKVFGHHQVHVLNNFRLWVEEEYPVESGEPRTVETSLYPIPELNASKVVDFNEVRQLAIDNKKDGVDGAQILDARSLGRWLGTDPEPRPSLSSGHMPGSISIPLSDLLDPKTKAFLPAQKLWELFQRKGVDLARPIITSCGSGVTAAAIDAALREAGYGNEKNRRLYDGSWTEWAQRVDPSDGLILKYT